MAAEGERRFHTHHPSEALKEILIHSYKTVRAESLRFAATIAVMSSANWVNVLFWALNQHQ